MTYRIASGMLESGRHGDSLENIFTAYRKSSPARWASWALEYPPELSPSTNQPMRRTSEDDGIPLAVKAAAIFCGSRSPLKKSPPKQGEHTRFPDNEAFHSSNVHTADVRPALTDTSHSFNPLLSFLKPSMGSGPVDSPGTVSRNSKSSPNDMSPAPDANAAAEDPSNLLTSNQKKRPKKKKARKARC